MDRFSNNLTRIDFISKYSLNSKQMILEKKYPAPLNLEKPLNRPMEANNLAINPKDYPNVLISTKNGLECLRERDIIYAKAMGSYTTLYLADGKQYTSSKKLKEVENALASNYFFRIHHSHLINLHHIKVIRNQQINLVLLSDGTELEISKRKKGAFFAIFKRL